MHITETIISSLIVIELVTLAIEQITIVAQRGLSLTKVWKSQVIVASQAEIFTQKYMVFQNASTD